MAGSFAFLPNARTVLGAAAGAPAPNAERLRLDYEIELLGNGAAIAGEPRVPIGAELKGPGDVVGFNRRIISRIEPQQGLRGTEPNYFPFVEFTETDFPWRFSFDRGTGPLLKPWIVLLALRPDEFEFVAPGRAPFARIRVFSPAASLPDLAQSWAFAHVHVAPAGTTTVADAVRTDPAAHFSRLLCTRRLTERTAYHLFLVPAYEAGRRAGIGIERDATPPFAFDAPAWAASAADPVELPVYFQSRFSTDEMEDVEMLLRRLRALTAAEVAAIGATRFASAAKPGYYTGYDKPGETFAIQGALRRPGAPVEAYRTEPTLAANMIATLQETIAGEQVGTGADGPNQPDPLVAMPPYGWRFRPNSTLSDARARQNEWFDRLNLDLKYRHAAGLGSGIVRRDQELFAAKAWEQYADVIEANRQLQHLEYAESLVNRLADRRFGKLAPDVATVLAEPMQPYTAIGGRTVLAVVRGTGTPTSYMSRALRQLSAKRRVRVSDPVLGTIVRSPAPAAPGDRLRNSLPNPAAPPRPGSPRANPADPFLGGFERDFDRLLGAAVLEVSERARRPVVPVQQFDTNALAGALKNRLTALPAAKARFVVAGLTGVESTRVKPVYRSPVIPLALGKFLETKDASALIPGVDALPQNTVVALEEDRRFIEAFLVGANHEMNQELRWREFPTDMRGTIFRRFWDRGRHATDPSGDDIAEIHTWRGKLGSHFAAAAPNRDCDLVVVIRGDIIRKLGQLIVVLNEAPGSSWAAGQGVDYEPVFFGRVGPDVAYYGFDVSRQHILSAPVRGKCFLVLHEPMGQLRFGLDVGTLAVRRARRNFDKLSLPFPLADLGRSYDKVPGRAVAGGIAPPTAPAAWDDLSWMHVAHTASGYVDFSSPITIPGQPDYWGANRTSASLARAFWQKPVAAVLPISRIL